MTNAPFAAALLAVVLADAALAGALTAESPTAALRALAWGVATRALPGVLLGLLIWYVAPVLNRHARIPDWRWLALAATAVLALVLQAVP